MSFRELLGDFNALRPGDLTVAESCGPAQLFLRQRDTVLGSLEQQSRTAMTIQVSLWSHVAALRRRFVHPRHRDFFERNIYIRLRSPMWMVLLYL